MKCFEGNDCLCLVVLYVHVITVYICIWFGYWNSQIFLFSFFLMLWLWLEVSAASFSLSELSICSSLICSTAEEVPVCMWPTAMRLCQMWWLCWLFLSQEMWLYFSLKLLTGKCFRGENFPNRSLSVAVSLCIYPHTVFAGCSTCTLAQYTLPLPGYIHYFLAGNWSASLKEVTLEISCAQTQIYKNILKSALKNQPFLHSRAVL